MNSLFQQLQNQSIANQKLSTPQNNLKALLNSNNPQSFIQNILKSNPQAQNLINTMKTSGLSPKDFFYQYARQKGIDPDEFINNLK